MKRKRGAQLGQHFLNNPSYARRLAQAASIHAGDTILEIGPGKGALTKALLETGARVIAVEKDEALVEYLQNAFATEIGAQKLMLIREDIRNFDPEASQLGTYALAANIPYYITGEIIRQFLTAVHQPRTMALLVQKEVAERIVARDGKESILSISVKAYGVPKIVAKVSRGNFSPPPSVDSAILLIDHVSKDFFDTISEKAFFELVRAGFSSKRKMLANNLVALFGKESAPTVLAAAHVDEKARAEDIGLKEWKRIAEQMDSQMGHK